MATRKKDAPKVDEIAFPAEVRATQVGYFGYLREVGDRFVCETEEQFAADWMEVVPATAAPADEPAE